MSGPKHTNEEKINILRQMRRPILDYIHERTVVVAAHDDSTVTDHGTGLLFEVETQLICVTAGHVIAPYEVGRIQLIGSAAPSNLRMSPLDKDFLSGSKLALDDVGFLKLPNDFRTVYPAKKFMSMSELEVDPRGFARDLAIVCGAPEAEHKKEGATIHRFGTLTYFEKFEEGFEWCPPFGEALHIEVPFPREVDDAFTGQTMQLPEAFGMSGGGVWRAHVNSQGIWHTGAMRLVGINAEFHKSHRIVYAVRTYYLLSLLARHYQSAREKLEREVSWTM